MPTPTFKVCTFIYENAVDMAFQTRKFVILKTGMTWAEAKEFRKNTRNSWTVKE